METFRYFGFTIEYKLHAKKINSIIFFKTKNCQKNYLLYTFFESRKSPLFPLREKVVVNLIRRRECFVGLSILLVYDCMWQQN